MLDVETTPDQQPFTTGVVETYERDCIAGWVDVATGAPPTEVSLHVDGLRVAVSWAANRADRSGKAEAREFAFRVHDLWDFIGPGNRVDVRSGGRVLPIAGRGSHGVPDVAGSRTLHELEHRLAVGEAFNRAGVLQLSREVDVAWQTAVLALHERLRSDVYDLAGHDVVLAYGTLLGAIREGGFIGHDTNFDCAFVSQHRDAAAAARDLVQLAFGLVERGYGVHAAPASIQIVDPGAADVVVTLFHLFVDESGAPRFPYGIAGNSDLPVDAVRPGAEITFAGAPVLVPAQPEAVLEHVYGADWREPNPAFRWTSARRDAATDAHLPAATIEEIYWSAFYARTTYDSGSSFFDLVDARVDLPGTVVDIGCGDGRDAYAFARGGRDKVTGLDRSHVGVRQAGRKADRLGLGERLTFAACDVSDPDRLGSVLTAARRGDDAMVFYARFFLHSIPEEVQRTLLGVVAECARPGDYFAAEFRTDRDESVGKVHGNHYRRFQNGPAFGRSLHERYGFVPLLEQEGNGFSPYRGEDPYLYRVVARRA